jgi:hypothetical protein
MKFLSYENEIISVAEIRRIYYRPAYIRFIFKNKEWIVWHTNESENSMMFYQIRCFLDHGEQDVFDIEEHSYELFQEGLKKV